MSITPQAIKDQEFQVKFRGYDTIEVKAYLELLAEEFFELHEVRRRQEDEYAELYEEVQAVRAERDNLLEEGQQRQDSSEESVSQFHEKDELIAELRAQIEGLEQKVASSELEMNLQQEAWERQETELREEIDQLKKRLDEKQNAASENSGEVEKLRGQIELLERQISDSRKEEVDFKAALAGAQRFAEEVRKNAKDEADRMLGQAIEEVETYRRDAEKELAHLPVEIEKLRQQKSKVRQDLKAVLSSYLQQLDMDQEEPGEENADDLSELFQSIQLDDDLMESEDVRGGEGK